MADYLDPSHDLQSMARIHRYEYSHVRHDYLIHRALSDGQKRPVYIYRFLTTGSIDGECHRRLTIRSKTYRMVYRENLSAASHQVGPE